VGPQRKYVVNESVHRALNKRLRRGENEKNRVGTSLGSGGPNSPGKKKDRAKRKSHRKKAKRLLRKAKHRRKVRTCENVG